jgi:ribonuclease R
MSELDRERLYAFFQQHPEKPWHLQDLQKRLKLSDRVDLRRELGVLVEEGRLVRTRRRSYGLPQEMNLRPGRLQVTAGGYGFVILDSEEKDLFIPAESLNGAWDGDRVLARLNPERENGRLSGEVVRILERKHKRVVGTLEYARGYAILRPDSPRLRERILLLPESVGQVAAGTRIVARIIWPEVSGEKDPFGEVEEVLGEGDDAEVETRAVIVKFDLKDTFDPDTLAEAKAVPSTVSEEMMRGRLDLREVNTFTIDGADAKDFDDAISLERLGKGKNALLRVGVHIADVSYYVAEGTSLDKEAKARATSVYLPGRVLPMLPEALSNGICSLVEGEPRLTLSVLVDLTKDGDVKGMQVAETVIVSNARLTYDEVQAFADGGKLPKGRGKLSRDLTQLLKLTQKLRAVRMAAGALDFDFTETKVDVDPAGELKVMPVRPNAARQLIEELMLLANRLVAEYLSKRDLPALYRVHEDPSEAKMQALQASLARLGYTLDLEQATPQDLQAIVRAASSKPESQLVNTLLLRSLKQARYSADNLGHFGLAFEHYLHFTSPIRRYPDLVVHRVLRAALQNRLSPTLKERLKSDFPALAQHTSERERLAEEAERDLTRYYQARWAKEHRGEIFNGLVTGVTNFGVFVALPNGVEGLLHVSQLDDDYYMYIEEQMMLLGKTSKRKFRLGGRLDVRILNANPTVRQIDLGLDSAELPDEEEVDARPERPPKRLRNPLTDRSPEDPEEEVRERVEGRRNRRGRRSEERETPGEGTPAAAPPAEPQTAGKRKRRVLVFGDVYKR